MSFPRVAFGRMLALAALAVLTTACSRSLAPTENRLGHGGAHRGADRAGGLLESPRREIPSAFGQGSDSGRTPGGAGAVGSASGDTVYFTSDSIDLTAEAQQTLSAQAGWLVRHRDAVVTIEGHADERGTREYNIALGARRAERVQAFLVNRGVDPRRLRTTSYGKERPVVSCADISCWSQNRRAQVIVRPAAIAAPHGRSGDRR